MEYQEQNNYPKAFLATGIILAVMLALCYFIVFKDPPQQDDGAGGILVNYGTTDAGMGNAAMSTEEPSVAEKANKEQPDKVNKATPTEEKPQVETAPTKVVTQDNEDAPAVATNAKKPSAVVATATAKPVKKPVVNQNALYKGASNKGQGEGDGTTNSPGNQGSRNGSPLASNYGEGGTGNGVRGTQWSFVSMPDVKNNNRMQGTVVVDITIDASGAIIEAHADQKKTRMGDLDLIDRCVNAVKNSTLTSQSQASGNQKGQITFKFDVD